MDIKDLKAYKKNPRKITDKQFELLSESLKEYGDLSGIVLNRRSGELVGGNQRTNFFRQDQANVKIVIEEEFKDPTPTGTVALGHVLYKGERYALRVVDWDEGKEEKANLLANKVGGTWDFDILANAFDVDTLLSSGFESFELGFGSSKDTSERQKDEDSLGDSMTSYLDGNVRQITFYFGVEEFENLLPRLDRVMEETGTASHTDAFVKLLEFYEQHR